MFQKFIGDHAQKVALVDHHDQSDWESYALPPHPVHIRLARMLHQNDDLERLSIISSVRQCQIMLSQRIIDFAMIEYVVYEGDRVVTVGYV